MVYAAGGDNLGKAQLAGGFQTVGAGIPHKTEVMFAHTARSQIDDTLEKSVGDHVLHGTVADAGRRKSDDLIALCFQGNPHRAGAFFTGTQHGQCNGFAYFRLRRCDIIGNHSGQGVSGPIHDIF